MANAVRRECYGFILVFDRTAENTTRQSLSNSQIRARARPCFKLWRQELAPRYQKGMLCISFKVLMQTYARKNRLKRWILSQIPRKKDQFLRRCVVVPIFGFAHRDYSLN
ncbi:hypothetical protein CH337_21255 [Rhodoblastus acidophilus]|nr:hypothetical protein CH337_21255 [Rhodoblastus acidophilus]